MDKLPDIVLHSWGGGTYLDRWTGLHLLAGCLLAFVSQLFGLPPRGAVLVTFGVLVCWEIVEHFLVIYEPLSNSAIDIFVGMMAFGLVFILASDMNINSRYIITTVLVVVFARCSIVAWHSWYKYHAAEENTLHIPQRVKK